MGGPDWGANTEQRCRRSQGHFELGKVIIDDIYALEDFKVMWGSVTFGGAWIITTGAPAWTACGDHTSSSLA